MVQIETSGPGRAAARRRDILEAASRLFRRRGLQQTGMREIAAELDMHVGNLYYYFASKEELLAYCQLETLDRLLALTAAVEGGAGSPSAARRLERLIVGHVLVLNEELPGSLAHLEVEALGEPWRRRVQDRRDAYEAAVRRLLETGVASGDFAPLDSRLATAALLGAVNWTVKWFRREGPKSALEVGREMANLFLAGLERRPPSEGGAP